MHTRSSFSCRVQFPTLPFSSFFLRFISVSLSSAIQHLTLTTIISHDANRDNIDSSNTKIYQS